MDKEFVIGTLTNIKKLETGYTLSVQIYISAEDMLNLGLFPPAPGDIMVGTTAPKHGAITGILRIIGFIKNKKEGIK